MKLTGFLIFLLTSFSAYAEEVFHIEKVTPNVYAFITPNSTRDMVDGNSTAILTDSGVIIIDTYGNPDIARRMIVELKKHTSQPVKYIINTHWHYDHILGNSVFKNYFPDVVIISQENTRRLMDSIVPKTMDKEPQASLDIIDQYKSAIASGRKEDSTLLTSYEKEIRYPETIRDLEYFIKNLPLYRYTPPELTFTDSLVIRLGKERVILYHAGKAHTSGDAIVYIPSQRILITGDLVVSPVPYALGAFHDPWMEALKGMLKLNADLIIPGHGETLKDCSYISSILTMLEQLNKEVEIAIKNNLTLQQAQEAILLPDFKQRFAGNHPDREWAFENYFLKPGVKSVYNRMKGIVNKNPN